MSKQTRVFNPIYSFLPTEVEGFDALAELALDMRWSWNHYADELWRQLDPDLWKITQNPWVILQTVSRDQMQRVLAETSSGGGARVVSTKLSAGCSELCRLFQHGIHVKRSAADLLGRAWQCRR